MCIRQVRSSLAVHLLRAQAQRMHSICRAAHPASPRRTVRSKAEGPLQEGPTEGRAQDIDIPLRGATMGRAKGPDPGTQAGGHRYRHESRGNQPGAPCRPRSQLRVRWMAHRGNLGVDRAGRLAPWGLVIPGDKGSPAPSPPSPASCREHGLQRPEFPGADGPYFRGVLEAQ